jgi:hypothetical protein
MHANANGRFASRLILTQCHLNDTFFLAFASLFGFADMPSNLDADAAALEVSQDVRRRWLGLFDTRKGKSGR